MKSLKTKPKKSQEDEETIETFAEEFEVEKLLDVKLVKNELFYKVKWRGYPLAQSTWEPVGHLTNCEEAMKSFEKPFNEVDRVSAVQGREMLASKGERPMMEKDEKQKKHNDQSKTKKKKMKSSNKNSSSTKKENKPDSQKKKKIVEREFIKIEDNSDYSTEENSVKLDVNNPVKFESRGLPEEGSLEYDIPLRVVDVTIKTSPDSSTNSYNCLVEWEERPTGFKPKNSKVTTKLFKVKYGALLVDFYESRISFAKH